MTRRSVVALALLGACVTVEDPDRVDTSWTLARLSDGPAACPSEWQTARLVLVDGTLQVSDDFSCAAGRGTSAHVPPGSYDAHIDMLDSDGAVVASTPPSAISVGGVAARFDATLYLDAGYATLSWTFPPGSGPCDDGNPLEWIYLHLDGPTTLTDTFSCHVDHGTSSPLLAGAYHASVSWGLDGYGGSDLTIEAPSVITQLPHVDF